MVGMKYLHNMVMSFIPIQNDFLIFFQLTGNPNQFKSIMTSNSTLCRRVPSNGHKRMQTGLFPTQNHGNFRTETENGKVYLR